jgi:hypothetical protein
MLARMLRAWRPRAIADPLTGLAHLREFQQLLDQAANDAITHALSNGREPRLSPTALAEALGVSRQAIYKRAAAGQAPQAMPGAPVAQPQELTTGEPTDH